jgi:hypothetical protein
VLVLNRIPTSTDDLPATAIWGAVVSPGVGTVGWADGQDITNSAWGMGHSPPPTGRALYLLVQALDEVNMRNPTLSPLVAFAVGDTVPWSTPHSVCDPQHPCNGVVLPLVCVGGTCLVACASDDDCRAAGAVTCADPDPASSIRGCM